MKKKVILTLEDLSESASNKYDGGLIWVNEFTETSAKQFSDQMLKAAENPYRPIIVYIDSYGGAVDALSTMISVTDSVMNTVITVAAGKAMSCGAILLSHGDIRCIAPHGRVMLHEASFGAGGHVNDVNNDVKESTRVNRYFMDLLAKNCGMKGGYKELRKRFPTESRDLYLTPNQAVRFGIADKIGIPKVRLTSKYEIGILEQ